MPELPYASATAGQAREREIRHLLQDAGAASVGFMVADYGQRIICQFVLNGRNVTVPVSVASYASAWKRAYPRGPRTSVADWEKKASRQAEIAVWAILADWIKAQVAMMAAGFLDVDTAFLPHIHAPDGRRIAEVIAGGTTNLLPPPAKEGKP